MAEGCAAGRGGRHNLGALEIDCLLFRPVLQGLYRRLYALQERKPGPGALLAGRPKSDALCAGLVRITSLTLSRIKKIGDKCGKEWDAHWQCLEKNNQVCTVPCVLLTSRNTCPAGRWSARSTSVFLSSLYVLVNDSHAEPRQVDPWLARGQAPDPREDEPRRVPTSEVVAFSL